MANNTLEPEHYLSYVSELNQAQAISVPSLGSHVLYTPVSLTANIPIYSNVADDEAGVETLKSKIEASYNNYLARVNADPATPAFYNAKKDFDSVFVWDYAYVEQAKKFWDNRRNRIYHARQALRHWKNWNLNVQGFYLTGVVSARKDDFFAVGYKDDGKSVSTADHSYLNAFFTAVLKDPFYGNDEGEMSQTGIAAQRAIVAALNPAHEKVESMNEICKANIESARSTMATMQTSVDSHDVNRKRLSDLKRWMESTKRDFDALYAPKAQAFTDFLNAAQNSQNGGGN